MRIGQPTNCATRSSPSYPTSSTTSPVADLAGHADTKTTEGYRHAVRETLPHAISAWDSLLAQHNDADFPAGNTFATWNPAGSSIPAATQNALRKLEWLTRRENLYLSGPAGTGERHFVEALGHLAIEQGYEVTWTTLKQLGRLVHRDSANGSATGAITPTRAR